MKTHIVTIIANVAGAEVVIDSLMSGLSHPENMTELDWWDGSVTPGNRLVIDIIKRTSQQIENSLKAKNSKLHYGKIEGVFLKDAAVLAGFGCVVRNNMLMTPSNGPGIRLRAVLIDAELPQNIVESVSLNARQGRGHLKGG